MPKNFSTDALDYTKIRRRHRKVARYEIPRCESQGTPWPFCKGLRCGDTSHLPTEVCARTCFGHLRMHAPPRECSSRVRGFVIIRDVRKLPMPKAGLQTGHGERTSTILPCVGVRLPRLKFAVGRFLSPFPFLPRFHSLSGFMFFSAPLRFHLISEFYVFSLF